MNLSPVIQKTTFLKLGISSGLQRITQTGFIFSSSGVSLATIIPVIYCLENMGRDPSEEETHLWIWLAEENIAISPFMKVQLSDQFLNLRLKKEARKEN
jgi:hypothetical protein